MVRRTLRDAPTARQRKGTGLAGATIDAHARWYRGAIVWGRRRVFLQLLRRARGGLAGSRPAAAAGLLLVPGALMAAGCGGGSTQDAHEKSATYRMELVSASFPPRQAVARPTRMQLRVRNPGPRTVPNVAITVDSFNYTSTYPELAANKRPIWAIERGPGVVARPPVETQEVSVPGSGQTAYVNTWALGPLPAGRTQTFTWLVVPVKPGLHIVHFAVTAGLAGKARARLASGGPVSGTLAVHVAGEPPLTHVDPATGRVVRGPAPAHP